MEYKIEEYKVVNGNVCCVEIRKNTTKVYDNLAEEANGNWCEVDTKEIRILIDEWCDKVRKFNNKSKNFENKKGQKIYDE